MANTVRETFDAMPTTHNAEMACGLNCVFQFDITGDGGGHWTVQFEVGNLTVSEGQAEKPDLRVVVPAQDWLGIMNHTLDYTGAYAAGKVQLIGDLTLHKKVPHLFVHTHQKPAV